MRLKLQVLALFVVVFLSFQLGGQEKVDVQSSEGPIQYDKPIQPVLPDPAADAFSPRGSQEVAPTGSESGRNTSPKIRYVTFPDGTTQAVTETSYSQEATTVDGSPRSLNVGEISLSISSLVFTLLGMALISWLRVKESITADMTFKLFGLVMVTGSALFLIASGWSQQQITPIVGILGTSLGFIFGKNMGTRGETRAKRTPTAKKTSLVAPQT